MKKLKVETDREDRHGRYPLWFNTHKLEEIHDYLFRVYNGYKFVIVMDYSGDEYYELPDPIPVYFDDEVLEELCMNNHKVAVSDRIPVPTASVGSNRERLLIAIEKKLKFATDEQLQRILEAAEREAIV